MTIDELTPRQKRLNARALSQEERLERLAPVGMDIVYFRFNPGGLDEVSLDVLNKELLIRLHESGVAPRTPPSPAGTACGWPSPTTAPPGPISTTSSRRC